eukprot:5173680-Pleurochrysis_carterae.AAC.1
MNGNLRSQGARNASREPMARTWPTCSSSPKRHSSSILSPKSRARTMSASDGSARRRADAALAAFTVGRGSGFG